MAASRANLEKIVNFSHHWLDKYAGGVLPTFGDMRPEDIYRSLPNMVLWQVLDGGADFRCRLCGEELNRNYGWDPKGNLLSEIIADNPSVAVFGDNFRLCIRRRHPLLVVDHFAGIYGTPKKTVGVIAPLSDLNDHATVTDILCCSAYLEKGEDAGDGALGQLDGLFERIENPG